MANRGTIYKLKKDEDGNIIDKKKFYLVDIKEMEQLQIINNSKFEDNLYTELAELPMCNKGHIISMEDIVNTIMKKLKLQ